MESPFTLSANEWYSWRKGTRNIPPWRRKFTNTEFLECERRRIEVAHAWYLNYKKSPEGANLEETNFYVLPIELNPQVAAETSYQEFIPKGLSALSNDFQMPMLMLLKWDIKLPEEYSYIRIIKGKKHTLTTQRNDVCYEAIVVDEWEYDEADKVYLDISTEKKGVKKILYETFHEEHIALALQAPLLSSPPKANLSGGIGLSSPLSSSAFAFELQKVLQMMLPPEYRSYNPPENFIVGKKILLSVGLNFHPAERHILSKKKVSSDVYHDAGLIDKEEKARREFQGEYSYTSSIVPKNYTIQETARECFKRLSTTEITLFNLDEFADHTILTPLIKQGADETIWATIVRARYFNPQINESEIDSLKFQKRLQEDWKILLPEFGYKENLEMVVRLKAKRSTDNSLRIAQSIARSEGRKTVESADLARARVMLLDSLEEARKHEIIVKSKRIVEKQKEQKRVATISTLLESDALTTKEIWEEVENEKIYPDIGDLQKLLDWLNERGYVWKDLMGRYRNV